MGNAHPYHSPQPTYILRSKISSAFCAGQPRYSTLLLTTTALKFTLSLNPSNRVETNAKTLPSCMLHSTWQLGLKHVFVGPLPTYVRLSGKRQTTDDTNGLRAKSLNDRPWLISGAILGQVSVGPDQWSRLALLLLRIFFSLKVV